MNHHLDDQGPEGLDSDELALRRMLHEAVQDVEPRDGTLDHLRRAVPARRARKRQAAVGMAAAALFVGTAVPAIVHVSHAGGSDANPSIAGQASEAHGGAGDTKGTEGGSSGEPGGSGRSGDQGEAGTGGGQDRGPGASNGDSGGSAASATSPTDAPACTAGRLGSATADVRGADSAGIVYGTFRVVNVSSKSCAVSGAVTLTYTAQGAADPARITVAEHTAGDAAAGLPDPSLYVPRLVLAPGSAYDVGFAWVPSETCPTTGGSGSTSGGGSTGGSSSPSPTASEQPAATDGTTTGTTGTAPQLIREGGTADGSVVVTYTASGGAPTVQATVPNACAGTIYRTGVLASS